MPVPPATTYSPPKSSLWGPRILRKSTTKAWETVARFFEECTVPEPPSVVLLTADTQNQLTLSLMRHRCSTEDELARVDNRPRFGAADPEIARLAQHFGPPTVGGTLWRLPGSAARDVVSFVVEWERLSEEPMLAEVSYSCAFRWRDPRTGAPVPHQGTHPLKGDAGRGECPASSVTALIRWREVHLAVNLWFPFAYGSPALDGFLAALRPRLPFRLAPGHFRIAVPSDDGSRYRATKAKPRRSSA